VLEDDLVTSRNFLVFMNQALDHYALNPKIFSIAGFSMPLRTPDNSDVFFTKRSSSWGWATWQDRWDPIDWEVKEYSSFKNSHEQRRLFNQMGSDLSQMLDDQMMGKINSWAIRWCFHQFQTDAYSVHPTRSKVRNIGFDQQATHTKERFDRFKTELDKSEALHFSFPDNIALDSNVIAQFVRPYSLVTRVKHKLLNLLPF
jgi:hypothetical protein